MASPFFDNAANAVSSAPGTGSFVLASASSGARSIATTAVADSIFHYHAIEGTTWEIGVGVYTHSTTTLTRNVKLSSNSNALVNFGAGVVVGLGISADRVQPHIGAMGWSAWLPNVGTSYTALGAPAITSDGTVTAGAYNASGTYRERRRRNQHAGAATQSSVGGVRTSSVLVTTSTTSRQGGFEYLARFGCQATLPSNPRALLGVANNPSMGSLEPTAMTNWAGFYRDSTGANLLFGCRGASGTAEGVDTGIALAANGWYEAHVWCNPGSQRINGILTRIDTPAVFIRLDVGQTNPPGNNTLLGPCIQIGQTTTATAFNIDVGSLYLRSEMF